MTLVLSVLTHQHVVQVSDRKLVWLRPDGSVQRENDEKNKAVLWCGRLAFAYTGLAELGLERRTDVWLASRLAEIESDARSAADDSPRDQAHLLSSLTDRVTVYFQGPRVRRIPLQSRRHAFVAVGWARFNGATEFAPYFARVSNFHDPSSGDELPAARSDFHLVVRRLEEAEGGYVSEVGHAFSRGERDALASQLSQVDRDPMAMIAVLGDKIREAAARSSTVGRGLMANVLPRDSIVAGQTEHMSVLGPPTAGTQTFMYVPADDDEPTQFYGPTSVCGGLVMSDFTAGPLAESEETD